MDCITFILLQISMSAQQEIGRVTMTTLPVQIPLVLIHVYVNPDLAEIELIVLVCKATYNNFYIFAYIVVLLKTRLRTNARYDTIFYKNNLVGHF